MSVSDNLSREMKRAKVSQYALERLSGVPQPTIQRIIKGSDPKASTIKKIAEALHISSAVILDDDANPTLDNHYQIHPQNHEHAVNEPAVTTAQVIASLQAKASPKTRALLQRLSEIDTETGLNEEHIELLEYLVSRYEAKKT